MREFFSIYQSPRYFHIPLKCQFQIFFLDSLVLDKNRNSKDSKKITHRKQFRIFPRSMKIIEKNTFNKYRIIRQKIHKNIIYIYIIALMKVNSKWKHQIRVFHAASCFNPLGESFQGFFLPKLQYHFTSLDVRWIDYRRTREQTC